MNAFKGVHNGPITYKAGAAPIAANTPVKFDASGNIVPTTAAADIAIGVTIDGADAIGDIVAVAVFGAHPGTVAVRAPAGGMTQGKLVAANGTPAAAAGMVIGVSLSAAAEGDIFEMAHKAASIY